MNLWKVVYLDVTKLENFHSTIVSCYFIKMQCAGDKTNKIYIRLSADSLALFISHILIFCQVNASMRGHSPHSMNTGIISP